MRQLNHQNVCNLNEVYESANDLYFVLDYSEGGELYN